MRQAMRRRAACIRGAQAHLVQRRNLSFRPKLVLGLESSCDDTCASVVSSDRRILSNVVIRSNHTAYKGIHPTIAVEGHHAAIPFAIKRALDEAACSVDDLDAIAYTIAPGMLSCLAVCSVAGKSLASASNKPSIGVHHMQAHALTPFLTENEPPEFPFLTLLVSGGHTLLILARSTSDFEILADTADEAIGNTIDKVCKLLDVDWSLGKGSPGAALEAFVASSPSASPAAPPISLPPIRTSSDVFSFSGLGSATSRVLASFGDSPSEADRRAVGRAFFDAAFGQLTMRTKRWITRLRERGVTVKAVVVSGGVASNMELRERLAEALATIKVAPSATPPRLVFPPLSLCTDNAAMIAWVGLDKLARGRVTPWDVKLRAKWSIEECEIADVAMQ